MSYLTIWEYKITSEKKDEFENLYGNHGEWVKLFQKFSGFIKTELHRDINNPDKYVTIDHWESKEAYNQFKKLSKEDFLEIDKIGEGLTVEEKHIGEFLTII